MCVCLTGAGELSLLFMQAILLVNSEHEICSMVCGSRTCS